MTTRYALFEGRVKERKTGSFRAAIASRPVPLRRRFLSHTDMPIRFGENRGADAPEFPLNLQFTIYAHV